MPSRLAASRLLAKHDGLVASGERSIARWQALMDEVSQAYMEGQRHLVQLQRKLIENAKGMAHDAFREIRAETNELFVELQDLARLRSTLRSHIKDLPLGS